jgi:hypothetical protein
MMTGSYWAPDSANGGLACSAGSVGSGKSSGSGSKLWTPLGSRYPLSFSAKIITPLPPSAISVGRSAATAFQ